MSPSVLSRAVVSTAFFILVVSVMLPSVYSRAVMSTVFFILAISSFKDETLAKLCESGLNTATGHEFVIPIAVSFTH